MLSWHLDSLFLPLVNNDEPTIIPCTLTDLASYYRIAPKISLYFAVYRMSFAPPCPVYLYHCNSNRCANHRCAAHRSPYTRSYIMINEHYLLEQRLVRLQLVPSNRRLRHELRATRHHCPKTLTDYTAGNVTKSTPCGENKTRHFFAIQNAAQLCCKIPVLPLPPVSLDKLRRLLMGTTACFQGCTALFCHYYYY